MLITERVPLASYTNFKVGGPAAFFAEIKSREDLNEALAFAKDRRLPTILLGGGTNVLVSDNGFPGLVLKMACAAIRVLEERIVAEGGATMGQVVAAARKAGLTGLEWAVGLPGTVGGAVCGNAGCFGGETKDVVESVELLDPATGAEKREAASALEFGYRRSRLQESGQVLLAATFRLQKGNPGQISTVMEGIRQRSKERIREQPLGARTAGSTFKGLALTEPLRRQLTERNAPWKRGLNRAGYLSAGFLIEQAGLKGLRFGDAEISRHHANFIVNGGRATASDIKTLIDTIKEQVANAFSVELQEEIRYVGF